jgi:hypothetical protein
VDNWDVDGKEKKETSLLWQPDAAAAAHHELSAL